MKILRFNNSPSSLDECWQKSIISTCQLPCFSSDIQYILSELPQKELKHWKFGFTKRQLQKACKTFKKQLSFCSYKGHAEWSNKSRLIAYEVAKKDLFLFPDQVLFRLFKKKQIKS